jgi:hypothetical protein
MYKSELFNTTRLQICTDMTERSRYTSQSCQCIEAVPAKDGTQVDVLVAQIPNHSTSPLHLKCTHDCITKL